jgi:hypothetical protein
MLQRSGAFWGNHIEIAPYFSVRSASIVAALDSAKAQ